MSGGTGKRRTAPRSYQPAIGTDFGKVVEVEAVTRGFLARIIATTAATGIVFAGGYSFLTGRYTAVITVWAVAGPIIGALMSHYFGPQRSDIG